LVFNHVAYTEGGSYNHATGYLTVPAAGVYYFIGSSGSNRLDSGAHFSLYVDNTAIDSAEAYLQDGAEKSSVHGVVHLQAGQRVWVRSNGDTYDRLISAFTGFLLAPDL
jgi:hypothetical protein